MKIERPKEPVKPKATKILRDEFAPRAEPVKIVQQTNCPCDPFDEILEAYARNPERWDGLE
ncbi:MAG: hypothetical protein ABSB33_00205 [Tepidisphaeraceae bacterium]|jgi:hypothetical protein